MTAAVLGGARGVRCGFLGAGSLSGLLEGLVVRWWGRAGGSVDRRALGYGVVFRGA